MAKNNKVADQVPTVNITIHPHTAFAQYITMSGGKTFCTEIQEQMGCCAIVIGSSKPCNFGSDVLTKIHYTSTNSRLWIQ